jgi:hypothetical protein
LDVFGDFWDGGSNRIVTIALGQVVTKFAREGIKPHDWVVRKISNWGELGEGKKQGKSIVACLVESAGNHSRYVDVLIAHSKGCVVIVPLYVVMDESSNVGRFREAESFSEAIAKHHFNIELAVMRYISTLTEKSIFSATKVVEWLDRGAWLNGATATDIVNGILKRLVGEGLLKHKRYLHCPNCDVLFINADTAEKVSCLGCEETLEALYSWMCPLQTTNN